MAEITCTTDTLTVRMTGLDRLWAFKSRLEVPLAHVEHVAHDPSVGFPGLVHIKVPGTYIPGVIAAGTFYQNGERVFWDVHDPQRAIVINLRNERYAKLVVDVDEPEATVERIRQAVRAAPGNA